MHALHGGHWGFQILSFVRWSPQPSLPSKFFHHLPHTLWELVAQMVKVQITMHPAWPFLWNVLLLLTGYCLHIRSSFVMSKSLCVKFQVTKTFVFVLLNTSYVGMGRVQNGRLYLYTLMWQLRWQCVVIHLAPFRCITVLLLKQCQSIYWLKTRWLSSVMNALKDSILPVSVYAT